MILLSSSIYVCYKDCWGFLRERIRYVRFGGFFEKSKRAL